MKHEITRVRHELKRRTLTVRRREFFTPRMLRLVLAGEDLQGFASLAPDDHIKIFTPGENGAEMRDYTPRRYDAAARELTLDFALHDAGPATAWARTAKIGDRAEIGGPRGSAVIPHDFDWWLLIGDETALPAIGRWVEELPAGTPVTSIVSVIGPEEEQQFVTKARYQAQWIHRPEQQADDPAPLLAAVEAYKPPAGEGFIWVAAEAKVARAIRKHVAEVWRHPLPWLKASGYWTAGKADAAEKNI